MKNILQIFMIGIFLLACNQISAQLAAPQSVTAYLVWEGDLDLDDLYENLPDSSTVDPMDALPLQLKVDVGLLNGIELDSIHIGLGTTSGTNDLLDIIVPYYQDMPDDGSQPMLTQNEAGFILRLGEYIGLDTYYINISLQNVSGEISPATIFSSSD